MDFNNCPKIQEGDSKQRRENGKLIHASILPKFKEEGYTIEYPIEYSLKEDRQPNNEITLRGRIDAINFDKQEIIDIKTTTKPIEKLDKNPYILQVGTYTKIIELQTGKQFSAHILIINTTQHIISLTREQIESAYKEMITRAIFASILSKDNKQDISGLSQSKWNHENRLSKIHEWVATHREQILARSRIYYATHREQACTYSRNYYAKHREKQTAYHRAWMTKHRKQQTAYMRSWRAKHPEKVKQSYCKWYTTHREQKLAYWRKYNHEQRSRKKAQQNASSTLNQYT